MLVSLNETFHIFHCRSLKEKEAQLNNFRRGQQGGGSQTLPMPLRRQEPDNKDASKQPQVITISRSAIYYSFRLKLSLSKMREIQIKVLRIEISSCFCYRVLARPVSSQASSDVS